jgi:hypothetical protein
MSLFKKDYAKLNEEELGALKEFNSCNDFKKEQKVKIMTHGDAVRQMQILFKFPFIKNLQSYFPNNYLNQFDLKANRIDYVNKLELFIKLLDDKSITERDVLNFIRQEEAQFIISSVLYYTDYGHHDRYIFQEVPLPPNHQADFLIVGKNSHGYHFLLIELENPYSNITMKDGNFGSTIRKGINQIEDWRSWMDRNFNSLRNVLKKVANPALMLPDEFVDYDSTRFQYVVIAGRRDDFSEKTYQLNRRERHKGIIIIHYDNLIDKSKDLIDSGRY